MTDKQVTGENTDQSARSPRQRRRWRVTRGVLNIILPVTETGWIIRSCRHMFVSHAQRIRRCLPEKKEGTAQTELNWAEAVEVSGLQPAQLERRFCRLRTRWRVFFWLLLTPAVFLCGMALHAATLPPVTFWRLLTTLLCLLACAGLSASRALIVTYRLWQLRERRVSVEEKGTFRDFLAQTHGWGPAVWQAVTATGRVKKLNANTNRLYPD